ncbi:sugar transferase [Campylobacter jejuni subsp. doylei]|nr:sugar transferase [Campylobacter jejuni subsp. doylei]
MLGEVLIKADKTWHKGGGFKLKNNIKKVNKEFQIFREIFKEFDQINSSVLKGLIDNKQLFLKEFPRIKNILKIHQDYKAILDNIFHNFNYFIQNFDLIEEWLLSDDFKERYKKENHPYPSLLDPKKLNDKNEEINYNNIPAELAWEMNLPLPENYEFVFVSGHCNGASSFMSFLGKCNVNIGWAGWSDGFDRYAFYYNYLMYYFDGFNALHVGEVITQVNQNDRKKTFALIQKKIKIIVCYRDPISILKTAMNVCIYRNGDIREINLSEYNYAQYLPDSYYAYNKNNISSFDLQSMKNYGYTQQSILNCFQNNEIIVLDIKKMDPEYAFNTMCDFADDFGFDRPNICDNFFQSKVSSYSSIIHVVFPITLKITINDYDTSIIINFQSNTANRNDTLLFFDKYLYINNILLNIHMLDKVDEVLNDDIKSKIASHINNFIMIIKIKYQSLENNKIIQEDILDYFRKNSQVCNILKNIIDEEFIYIKQHYPDIVASWKYYQEFEKICKENK